jgi:hypothetical protein
LFVTDQQKHEVASGGLGVFASGFAAAWFANFDYRELPPGYTIADPGMAPAPLPDRVTSWEISTVFDGATLADVSRLDAAHTDALQWQRLDAEDTGITNISRLRILAEGANTVFARLRIDSDRPQPLDLHFGYSDTAQVFLNGRKLYAGNRLYESQDYRYLGTIGLFDSLSLDLRSGSNEVLIAVGERFGGWGLMAAIDPPPGVSVRD